MSNTERIERDFTYHPPTQDNQWLFAEMRTRAKKLALWIDNHLEDSREKSLAITKLEEAVFWVNAGIAIDTSSEIDQMVEAGKAWINSMDKKYGNSLTKDYSYLQNWTLEDWIHVLTRFGSKLIPTQELIDKFHSTYPKGSPPQ